MPFFLHRIAFPDSQQEASWRPRPVRRTTKFFLDERECSFLQQSRLPERRTQCLESLTELVWDAGTHSVAANWCCSSGCSAYSDVTTGDNVVAVRLNNNWNAQLPPLTGDHTFQGGIYRDVNVVITDLLHITWYGTWVTTPTLATNTGSSSTVEIKTEVQNSRSAAVSATLKTDIVDSSGKVVTTISTPQQIAAGATVTFDQTTPAVSSPSLWHPDHPTMYQAISYLSDGTGNVDTFTTPFGFRWFTWSGSQGFSLNGSHYWMQGGNVHQDHAGWGDGVADSALYRDVKMVKDAGMNFIRGSHYPKAPAFADACDQLGILFWSENCFWGGFGGGGGWPYNGAYPSTSADYDTFDTNVLASLTDMIR